MHVSDEAGALQQLSTTSYYRLSGYWYPFRAISPTGERLSEFAPNTSFDQVLELYNFDRQLRTLLLQAISRIEIAIRTQLTYQFGHAHGPFGHTEAVNFHPRFDHHKWLTKLEVEIERAQDKFIHHYKANYTGYPVLPIWMTTEVMSLGSLSFFCKGLNNKDTRAIADFFNLPQKALSDWLHTITYVRNLSAHHSRVWNRIFAIRPGRMKDRNWQPPITPVNNRLFYVLLMLRHLQTAIGGHDDWTTEVNDLIAPVAADAQYRQSMGIPENWKTHPLWH